MSAPADDALWRRLASKSAPGIFDERAGDGSFVFPLQHRLKDDLPRPWRRSQAWAVVQRVDHPDAVAANRMVLADLEGGADFLAFVTNRSPFARGFGLPADAGAIAMALEGVELDLIGLRIEAGRDTFHVARALADLVEQRRLAKTALPIDLGYDPIGWSACDGKGWAADELAQVIACRHRAGFAGAPLLADGRPYHEAGASEAQELAAVLATAVAYLRHLEMAGIALEEGCGLVAMLLPADADVPLTLAKMRAARRLWARVQAASGLMPKPVRLHAETSWRMMTRFDLATNSMRTTAACAASGLGGADTVTVLPLTLAVGLPDEAARRLARNSGRLLQDEAGLAEVDDPAGGAGGFEALTTSLCEEAWRLFQEIERGGGVEEALRRGTLQALLARTAEQRAAAFAMLGRGIVGTSRFPNLAGRDTWRTLAEPSRPSEPAPPGDLVSARDAEPFEALRGRAEAGAAKGKRPTVYLARLGAPSGFGARANEAANVFAIAGIAAIHGGSEDGDVAERSTPTPAELFARSGSTVACLCGSDTAYAAEAESLIATLRASGAKRIALVSDDRGWLDRDVDWLLRDSASVLPILRDALDLSLGSN